LVFVYKQEIVEEGQTKSKTAKDKKKVKDISTELKVLTQ